MANQYDQREQFYDRGRGQGSSGERQTDWHNDWRGDWHSARDAGRHGPDQARGDGPPRWSDHPYDRDQYAQRQYAQEAYDQEAYGQNAYGQEMRGRYGDGDFGAPSSAQRRGWARQRGEHDSQRRYAHQDDYGRGYGAVHEPRGFAGGNERSPGQYGLARDADPWNDSYRMGAAWWEDGAAADRRDSAGRHGSGHPMGQPMGQSHRGRGPKNYQRSDARISEDVCDRLSDDHDLDASDIEVSVSDREVTLAGEVTSKQAKRRAEDCADSCSGVTHVQNNLRVRKSHAGDSSQAEERAKNK